MEIKILMTKGCAGCASFYSTAEKVIGELAPQTKLTKIDDLMEILSYHTLNLPTVIIDGEVIHSGEKLSSEEMKKLFSKYINHEK